MQSKYQIGVLAIVCLATWMSPTAAATASEPATTVVYLVRHAEKSESTDRDGSLGPPLNEAGRARAAVLVEVLAAEKITHIFSTDYRRTRETAQPLADSLGLKVESYDPRVRRTSNRMTCTPQTRHFFPAPAPVSCP